MSTKATIINDKVYHLYEEAFDNDNVYLDLDDLSGCCFELWTNDTDEIKSHATISIPVKAWRNIVRAWNKSSWARDESRDGSSIMLDGERLRRISISPPRWGFIGTTAPQGRRHWPVCPRVLTYRSPHTAQATGGCQGPPRSPIG